MTGRLSSHCLDEDVAFKREWLVTIELQIGINCIDVL